MSKSSSARPESKAGKGIKAKTEKERGRIARRARKANRKIEVVSSTLSYQGPLFDVYTDEIRENGRQLRRDVIRHDGSVVILALDDAASKRDPLVIMEKQYRHAAGEYLLELPAGKMEAGEDPLAAAKRELLEETGFRARRWRKFVRYFASPGFLGEFMQVFVAQDLTPGRAQPEYDEQIELQRIPFSKLLRLIDQGKIHDGKTLIAILLYERMKRLEKAAATKRS